MLIQKEDLVIEIGCEDLPSWTGKYLKERWLPYIESILQENRINYDELKFFSTPRRLILYFTQMPIMQDDKVTEISGPSLEVGVDKEGNYTPAAIGFASSNKIKVEDLVIREKKGKKVLSFSKEEKGLPVKKILGGILVESIKKTEMPRAMKWEKNGIRFIRPIRWIFALLGTETIEIKLGNIKSSNYSFGHRVLSPKKFKPISSREYFDKILKNFVIFDEKVRLEFLKASITKGELSDTFFEEKTLEEIVNTVEYPLILKCPLKEEYLKLPQEVVSEVIRKLNGIPLFNELGKLSSYYISVTDGVEGEEIRNNYLSVLESKMEDAIFFMDKDTSVPFDRYTEELKKISYHPRWGSVYDRVERFKKISDILLKHLNLTDETIKNVYNIISLCKNDLPTLMVTEFPSLQGIIGRIYAHKNGFNPVVAKGIEQHYYPKVSNGKLPENTETSIVSLVERIESLCGFFLDDIEIKGAGDPYGVKKITNGLVELLWHEKLNIPLESVIKESLQVFVSTFSKDVEEKLLHFILQRVENILAGEKLTSGIRKAVISIEKTDLFNIRLKTDALKKFFAQEKGVNVLVSFIRIANILKQAEEKKFYINKFVDETLLLEETEKEFYNYYKETENILRDVYKNKEYILFLNYLGNWREIIDKFFDDILVMCEDKKIRGNRIALLKQVNDIFSLFVDFSLIPIVEVENA